MDATDNFSVQKYGRDVLLQLRMHPLSLRKPDTQKLDIVKDKLYLHQINNFQAANKSNSSWSPESFYSSLKYETDSKFGCHRSFQDFFPCQCSFNGVKKVSTATHGMLPFKKWQYSLPNYISPIRKNSLTLPDCQLISSIEDEFSAHMMWSKCCTPFGSQSKVTSKAVVKNEKKVLPIIDPANGKNILDDFAEKSTTLEDTVKLDSVTKNHNISEVGDHPCYNEENKDSHFNQKCGDTVPSAKSAEEFSCISQLSESKEFCDISSAFTSSCDKKVKQNFDNIISTDSYEESEKEIRESDTDKLNLNESVKKCDNQQKLNFALLKEKLYSMKKEQQKMAVFQNFLRFKKHQIDESMRNIDDKKIEIANWEFNLLNKAKDLQEKESWLETKKLTLQNKAQVLEEKERSLSKKESILNHSPKETCKVEENEKYGTECNIISDVSMNSIHETKKNNCDYSSINNQVEGSLDLNGNCESSTEKSSV